MKNIEPESSKKQRSESSSPAHWQSIHADTWWGPSMTSKTQEKRLAKPNHSQSKDFLRTPAPGKAQPVTNIESPSKKRQRPTREVLDDGEKRMRKGNSHG